MNNLDTYIEEIASKTGLIPKAITKFQKEYNLTPTHMLRMAQGLGRKQLSPLDVMTAIVGNHNNDYTKELVAFVESNKAFEV